jgi:L-threonylcarbamoyladenylate synthase
VYPQNHLTRTLPAGEAAISEAARLIREGMAVAVPTETVYGLAADATREEAVQSIYAAKGRPSFNPLIVHVPNLEFAERLGIFGEGARRLAGAFWPGPLTMVVPLRADSGLAPAVTAGLATVALRCPFHPAMRALLAESGRPLAAPSANASGRISPTRAEHVLSSLGGRIPLILDGGESGRGIESTIVGVDPQSVSLLRPGPVLFADIMRISELPEGRAARTIQAPGQLENHYAPTKPLRLDATERRPDEWLIGFGTIEGDDSLSPSADLDEAAARLFAALHRAEAEPPPRIAVAPVPAEGLGAAINDRLRRAAAPRA